MRELILCLFLGLASEVGTDVISQGAAYSDLINRNIEIMDESTDIIVTYLFSTFLKFAGPMAGIASAVFDFQSPTPQDLMNKLEEMSTALGAISQDINEIKVALQEGFVELHDSLDRVKAAVLNAASSVKNFISLDKFDQVTRSLVLASNDMAAVLSDPTTTHFDRLFGSCSDDGVNVGRRALNELHYLVNDRGQQADPMVQLTTEPADPTAFEAFADTVLGDMFEAAVLHQFCLAMQNASAEALGASANDADELMADVVATLNEYYKIIVSATQSKVSTLLDNENPQMTETGCPQVRALNEKLSYRFPDHEFVVLKLRATQNDLPSDMNGNGLGWARIAHENTHYIYAIWRFIDPDIPTTTDSRSTAKERTIRKELRDGLWREAVKGANTNNGITGAGEISRALPSISSKILGAVVQPRPRMERRLNCMSPRRHNVIVGPANFGMNVMSVEVPRFRYKDGKTPYTGVLGNSFEADVLFIFDRSLKTALRNLGCGNELRGDCDEDSLRFLRQSSAGVSTDGRRCPGRLPGLFK